MTSMNTACREICLNSTLAISNNITIKKAPMYYARQSFPGGSKVKNTPDNAGDSGSILGSGTHPRVEMATCSSIHAWKISWAEVPGGLQTMGSQRVRHN